MPATQSGNELEMDTSSVKPVDKLTPKIIKNEVIDDE
jgi:hypothetical protein